MRKIWDIPGGIHPPENKLQSVQRPIIDLPLFSEYVLPVGQHIGTPALPVVVEGDHVLKGQVIADAQGIFSAAVHAPTSGTVSRIGDHVVAHPSGLPQLCITVTADGEDRWTELTPCEDPETLDHATLVERIRQAGLAGMGGAGFPTAVKLNPRSTDKIRTLILNGTECEPYITADDMLMREGADGIVAGALLLARMAGSPEEILIGVEDNKPEAIATLQKAAAGTRVEVVVFPTKYPSGGEKQLIQILTGVELPSGKLPAHIGVLVQNVGTAYAAWRAVRFGEPLIERITTVVGEAITNPGNVRARIGTPIRQILAHCGLETAQAARLIIGGPMMGIAIEDPDIPVVKTTNCLLVPSHAEMPEAPPAQPCIRCGLCAEVCPARLLPQQLYWYAQAQDSAKLLSHNLFDCIECGACSYTCPSALPLVQYYRAAKGAIRQQEADKQKADRARQRFEQRQTRIERAEQEKEQKRLARKKAAEQAREKLTQTSGEAAPTVVSPPVAPQAAADERSKLERALTSATLRVEHVQKQLTEAVDAAQKEKLSATLKQAELNQHNARQKLNALASAGPVAHPLLDKMALSPLQAQEQSIATLEKRLAVAEEKYVQAREAAAPTQDALAKGVEKLRGKLEEARHELERLAGTPAADAEPIDTEAKAAASEAIIRAQRNAARRAAASPLEKQQTLVESLTTRLEKARAKLADAEQSGSDQREAYALSVATLEGKLQDARDGLERLAREPQS